MKLKRLLPSFLKNSTDELIIDIKKTDYIPDPEFIKNIYFKTIIQAVKTLGTKSVTLSSENIKNNIPLLEKLFEKNIPFSLAYSENSYSVSEYFLEKFGIPVPVVGRIKSGLYIYMGGHKIPTENNVPTLDLSGDKTEFFLKDNYFPERIKSFSVLNNALRVTNKSLSDIIVKPCIIYNADE